jgi:hypothetical protein
MLGCASTSTMAIRFKRVHIMSEHPERWLEAGVGLRVSRLSPRTILEGFCQMRRLDRVTPCQIGDGPRQFEDTADS